MLQVTESCSVNYFLSHVFISEYFALAILSPVYSHVSSLDKIVFCALPRFFFLSLLFNKNVRDAVTITLAL